MEKKLLVDRFGIIKPVLTEDSSGHMVMRGEFGRSDIPTENKRIYPRSVWEREIQKISPAISEGKVLGELDHPSDGKTSLKRVSHVMTKLEMTPDGRIMGEAKIMDNEHGRQLKSILAAGGAVGVSSRGLGSTAMNEDGFEVVQDDYSYMTHDAVADPAVKTSYPTFTMEAKTVVKEADKENVMEAKEKVIPVGLTEDEVKKVVEAKSIELQEQFKKDSEKLVEEAKTLAKEEAKKELEADPAVAAGKLVVEDIAKLLRPFILPADLNESVKTKESEIAELRKEIQAKDRALAELKESSEKSLLKATLVAKNLGMLLHFEKTISEDKEDKESIRALVGDPRKFTRHEELVEAIEGARKALSMIVEKKTSAQKREKELIEKYEQEKKALEEKAAKSESALKESNELARQMGLKAYVLKRTLNNPNRSKIEQLSENIGSKQEADKLIEKFSVEAPLARDYNSIRQRFKKLEESTLVEDHLKVTGDRKAETKAVVEGVEGEMVDLFPGASLEQVKELIE